MSYCYICREDKIKEELDIHYKSEKCMKIRNSHLIDIEDVKFVPDGLKKTLYDNLAPFDLHKNEIEENLTKRFTSFMPMKRYEWSENFIDCINTNDYLCGIYLEECNFINLNGKIYIDKHFFILVRLCFPAMNKGFEKCKEYMKKNDCYDEKMVNCWEFLLNTDDMSLLKED